MPEIQGLFSSAPRLIDYGARRIDPGAMAAARLLWKASGQPNQDFSMTSVIRQAATMDPLLSSVAQSIFHRYEIMKGMASNGGTLELEMVLPGDARYILEETVGMMVRSLKHLARDPVRYYMAALIDICGDDHA